MLDRMGVVRRRRHLFPEKGAAKDLGLGGYLIWAIDQDDEHLTALQAVISPKKLGDMGAASDKGDW